MPIADFQSINNILTQNFIGICAKKKQKDHFVILVINFVLYFFKSLFIS